MSRRVRVIAMEAHRHSVEGRAILVVEDEFLIAMDIAQALESAGARPLVAYNMAAGLSLIDEPNLAAAILDQKLGHEGADDICAVLAARNVPFLIYSGYRHDANAPCGAGAYVAKPVSTEVLVSKVADLLAQHLAPNALTDGR